VNRNRRLVQALERIAEALERANPKPAEEAPLPEIKDEDLHRGETAEEKAERLVRLAVAAGVPITELEDWDPEL
jgi:hypothetical protein